MSVFTTIRDKVTQKLTMSTDSGRKKLVVWGMIGALVLVSMALILLAPKKKESAKAATPVEVTVMRPPNRSLDLEMLNRQLNALKQERAGDQRTRELAETDLKRSLLDIEKKVTDFGAKPPGISDDALEKAIRSRVDNKLSEMKNTGELRGGTSLGSGLPTPGLNTALPGSSSGVSSVPLLPRDGGGSGLAESGSGPGASPAPAAAPKRSLRASTESSPAVRTAGPSGGGGVAGAGATQATNVSGSGQTGNGGTGTNANGSGVRFDGAAGGAIAATQNNALRVEAANNGDANASSRDLAEGLGKKKNDGIYLPLGSIISGVALTGFDAPTGQAAQKNPVPMLIRVKAQVLLPNRFTADLGECFVIASGFGTLTTQRAKLRTNGVSCVRADGKAVEAQLAGYLVGHDGREGIEGTLVSKTGEMLANSIRAGFLSAAATRLSGATSMIPVTGLAGPAGAATAGAGLLGVLGESAEGSAMSGAGSAINQVAKIYADMAKEAWPVVEVLPGQPVTIVLTSGVNLRFGGK